MSASCLPGSISAHNVALATLRPVGGTMVVPAFGRHEGREVRLQDVTDGNCRFTRAVLDGVAVHFPAGVLSDDQIVRLTCDQVPVCGDQVQVRS